MHRTSQQAASSSPSPAQLAALQRYADTCGRGWKRMLSTAWETGQDAREPDGPLLRQVRNEYGPQWLYSKANTIRPGS